MIKVSIISYMTVREDRQREAFFFPSDGMFKGRQSCGRPVWVSLRVERAHIVDLFEVDVGEDQLVVGGVDDGGSVGAGKYVGGGERPEGPQHSGLRAQCDLLPLAQCALRWKKGKTSSSCDSILEMWEWEQLFGQLTRKHAYILCTATNIKR